MSAENGDARAVVRFRRLASTEPRCVSAENDGDVGSTYTAELASTEPRCVSAENLERLAAPGFNGAALRERGEPLLNDRVQPRRDASTEPRCVSAENAAGAARTLAQA